MSVLARFFCNCVMAVLGSTALWVLVEKPCLTIFAPSKAGAKKKVQNRELAASKGLPDMVRSVSQGSINKSSVHSEPNSEPAPDRNPAVSSGSNNMA